MSGQRRREPMGGHGPGMRPTEKAKDFKGSMGKLFRYMSRYKLRFVMVFIFAVAGTVFNIAGPKILGKATTELFNGLVAKVNGTGGINFGKIGMILLWTLGLYLASACFSFIQGWIMTGISNDVTYNLRKDISKKINKLPLNYFESRTNGEILSRVTNDVDTLQNESEPESDPADHIRNNTDRCIYYDAVHQCVDDTGSPFDPAGIYVYHSDSDEALTEIFPGTAELPWCSQWPDRRKLWRP